MTDSSTWVPAPLEPEVPPTAWHGVTDQGGAPEPAPDPGGTSRGPWWWVLGAALLLGLVGAGAWLLFLRPPAGAAAADGVVADITSAPDEAWTYKYAPRGDEQWISEWVTVRPVGGDRFAVLADLNTATYHEQTDSSWYSGYDEHFDTGFADGQRYRQALDAYNADSWSNSYPAESDYFTLSGTSYNRAVNDYGTHQGWFDGFYDGAFEGQELNRAVRPDPPPTLGFVAMVDRADGTELWRVDMEALDFEVSSSSAVLHHLSAEGHVIVSVSTYGDEEITTTLTALDPDDGSVVSEVDLEGYAVATGDRPGAPLVAHDEASVLRLDTGDLDGDYVWSAGIPGIDPSSSATIRGDAVQLSTEEGAWWLDAATGFEPAWFDGADHEVSYDVLDDVVLRLESSDFGYYIDALDRGGRTLWTSDAERVLTPDGSGGHVLLVGERGAESGTEYLMRLDPRTGEKMWDEEYDDRFSWTNGTIPRGLVLEEDDRSVVLDLETGERLQRLRGTADHLGTGVIYGSDDDRVRAWDAADGSELWSVRLSDTESLRRAGDALLVQDTARRELSLLE